MRADLHLHSRWSDGSDDIASIMRELSETGVTMASVTDHDTVAHLEDLEREADISGIRAIPGIEISAFDPETKKKAHILGYAFTSTRAIAELCQPVLERRNAATIGKIGILMDNGWDIDLETVRRENGYPQTLYKQHIMVSLANRALADGIYGTVYKSLFKGTGICSGDIEYPDYRDAIRAIHECGGLAVLAHPGQQDLFGEFHRMALSGLDGIEYYHEAHRLEDHKKIAAFAEEHGLCLTGGSDSHGSMGSFHRPGAITAPRSVFTVLG